MSRKHSIPDEPLTLFELGYRMKADTTRDFGKFLVTNPQGVTYTVVPLENRCTCPDCRINRNYCKHLRDLYALMLDCWYAVNDDRAHESEMFDMRCEMDFVLERRGARVRSAA